MAESAPLPSHATEDCSLGCYGRARPPPIELQRPRQPPNVFIYVYGVDSGSARALAESKAEADELVATYAARGAVRAVACLI